MRQYLRFLMTLLLVALIAAPSEISANSVVKASKSIVKKKYGKKKYSKKSKKKRYSKKRGKSKKSRKSKRYSKRRVVSSYFYVPTNYQVYGIDVSRYQGTIDWDNISAPSSHNFNLNFAFIKATEGVDRKDVRFQQNWSNAAQRGIKRGAYHFYRPNSDPYLQAQNFISSVQISAGDLPPVIDIEHRGLVSDYQFNNDLKVFISLLEKEYGVKPIIYTGYRFFHKHLSDPHYQNYPFWVAHYGKKDLDYRANWKFWQFTCKGRVNGIRGHVDLNVFNGSLQELYSLCKK